MKKCYKYKKNTVVKTVPNDKQDLNSNEKACRRFKIYQKMMKKE